jgi:transposase
MIGGDMKVCVATTPIDMRKSFDALAAVVEKFLGHDPRSGNLFVFRSKGGQLAKVLSCVPSCCPLRSMIGWRNGLGVTGVLQN